MLDAHNNHSSNVLVRRLERDAKFPSEGTVRIAGRRPDLYHQPYRDERTRMGLLQFPLYGISPVRNPNRWLQFPLEG